MTSKCDTTSTLFKMGLTPSSEPVVMGILNCTPDSFFDGSRKQTEREIADRAVQIMQEGGKIIDVGAYSTRPGALEVSEEEELRRMRGALEIIRREHPDVLLSIDTFRPAVATMAVEEFGADIINDVSEGREGLFPVMQRLRVPYILMSLEADMDSMIRQFQKEIDELKSLGVNDIILDPGYGFGKDVIDGNFAVLNAQQRLREVFPDLPVLAGVSRKRMVWQLLGCKPSDTQALHGTMLLNLMALQNGATILRVHDVKEAADTITIYRKAKENEN